MTASSVAFAGAPPALRSSALTPSLTSTFTPSSARPSAPPTLSPSRFAPTAGIFPWSKNKKSDDAAAGPNLTLDVGYAFLAHPQKQTGEDAFFVDGGSIGVFDGVSTVAGALNVDPRLYSQTLARLTSSKVKALGPDRVVRAAIEASQENDQAGASTACVVGMEPSGRLFGVNLGDSGVLVVRDGKKLFATTPQQHFHNCPYQLTSIANAGVNSGDSLAMGQNVQLKLKENDVLCLASDGLWDNMEMAEIVQRVGRGEDTQGVADSLSDQVMINQQDLKFRSPFQIGAEKAGQDWQGGKEDDLTIVIARVAPLGKDGLKPTVLLSTLPEA